MTSRLPFAVLVGFLAGYLASATLYTIARIFTEVTR